MKQLIIRWISAAKDYLMPPIFDINFIESPKPKRKRKTKKGGKSKRRNKVKQCECYLCQERRDYENSKPLWESNSQI